MFQTTGNVHTLKSVTGSDKKTPYWISKETAKKYEKMHVKLFFLA